MARYIGTVEAPHSAEEVWHYLADLRSAGEWDPSVDEVELVGGEPRTEDARYRLEVRFRGRSITLPYRIVEVDPTAPRRLRRRDRLRRGPRRGADRPARVDRQQRDVGRRPPAPRDPGRLLDLPLRGIFTASGRTRGQGLGKRLRNPQLGGPVSQVQR